MEHHVIAALSLQAPRTIRDSLETKYALMMDRGLLDDVKVMASEAVTNSVVHSGRPDGDPISLSSNVTDGVLRVEIGDDGQGVANLSARSLDPPSGLGYLDILSDRWSSHQNGTFIVWFEIDVTSHTMLARANTMI